MKLYLEILTVLGLLTVLTAAFVLPLNRRPTIACGNRIVVAVGRQGAGTECVCIGGVLASCLKPGPYPKLVHTGKFQ